MTRKLFNNGDAKERFMGKMTLAAALVMCDVAASGLNHDGDIRIKKALALAEAMIAKAEELEEEEFTA